MTASIAFIGGGNMACAIIAGLMTAGWQANTICVVDPQSQQRDMLQQRWGLRCYDKGNAALAQANIVVWAVKPQNFFTAASDCRTYTLQALHVSVMAGLRSTSLFEALSTQRIVRAMPNTPALIGQGIAGLYACALITPAERKDIEALLSCTGKILWFDKESELDAVTAISGSGPAYVLYVMQALTEAAQVLGLSQAASLQLVLETFRGATELALSSTESLAQLRNRVVSKGGTTGAALQILDAHNVHKTFIEAAQAAAARAQEMGVEMAIRGTS